MLLHGISLWYLWYREAKFEGGRRKEQRGDWGEVSGIAIKGRVIKCRVGEGDYQ
jgi:hypothetical protein